MRDMETIRSMLGCSQDLAEVYSPPRIASEANRMGMKGGFSLDFTTPEPDGYVWDFERHECRKRALNLVRTVKPFMLVGSPECTPFSQIQNLNMRTPEGREKVMKARARGEKQLEFCRKLYMEQLRNGRYFLHEHPHTAASWQVESMVKLRNCPAVHTVEAHMCAFGMRSKRQARRGFCHEAHEVF